MKTTLACFLFILMLNNCQAQVFVDDVNLNAIDTIKYCTVVGNFNGFSNKYTISIDYGQRVAWSNDTRVNSADGKKRKFNSMVEALNFMVLNGWKLHTAYTVPNASIYYLLEKAD